MGTFGSGIQLLVLCSQKVYDEGEAACGCRYACSDPVGLWVILVLLASGILEKTLPPMGDIQLPDSAQEISPNLRAYWEGHNLDGNFTLTFVFPAYS